MFVFTSSSPRTCSLCSTPQSATHVCLLKQQPMNLQLVFNLSIYSPQLFSHAAAYTMFTSTSYSPRCCSQFAAHVNVWNLHTMFIFTICSPCRCLEPTYHVHFYKLQPMLLFGTYITCSFLQATAHVAFHNLQLMSMFRTYIACSFQQATACVAFQNLQPMSMVSRPAVHDDCCRC